MKSVQKCSRGEHFCTQNGRGWEPGLSVTWPCQGWAMRSRWSSLLFPGACPCGRRAEALCPSCAALVRPAPRLPIPPGVDSWWAPFAYDGPVRELLARFKYANRRSARDWLAEAMETALGAIPVDVVTWVPTTLEHRRARGFDQAELLARAVAHRCGFPVRAELTRADGRHQTGLSRSERLVGPTFTLVVPHSLAGRRVLVVDDVSTSGATLSAAARVVRAGGASWVGALTAARTPRPGGSAPRSGRTARSVADSPAVYSPRGSASP